MLYTRNQLVKAMHQYNKAALENPDNFVDFDDTEACAEGQVDNLLSFVEKRKRIIYRDAISGKIVTKDYAEKNPDTTTRENR